jgi:hypothetical protein
MAIALLYHRADRIISIESSHETHLLSGTEQSVMAVDTSGKTDINIIIVTLLQNLQGGP